MRLLSRKTKGALTLTTVADDDPPPFAILSHTWGKEQDEISYRDVERSDPKAQADSRTKAGLLKVEFCLQQAARDGIQHVWIDTCCINKDNQQELNKAINWMFRWYAKAEKCYVYMADVVKVTGEQNDALKSARWRTAFESSRWFTRGWTLQELLAPRIVEFYDRDGNFLCDKATSTDIVASAARVPSSALIGVNLRTFTLQQRFDWAKHRQTKEPEDQIYSLFGILGVTFPPNYGEGYEATIRRLRTALLEAYSDELLVQTFDKDKEEMGSNDVEWLIRTRTSLDFSERSQRRANIQKHTSRTCEWLLVHPLYMRWLNGSSEATDVRLLWIKGKPGAGKSTLMKFADADRVSKSAPSDIVISFYFNARGGKLERSTERMYRAMLCQLIDAVGVGELEKQVSVLRPHRTQLDASWSIEILQILFSAIALGLEGRKLFIYIDALDECNDHEVQEMLSYLEELGQSAVEDRRDIWICFASRHYPALSFTAAIELKLEDQQGHADDLERHTRKTLRIGEDKRARNIRDRLLVKANGIFIWAVLVVKILNADYARGHVLEMYNSLNSLPPDMSNLFRLIIGRDDVHLDDFKLCLQIIFFAEVPLSPYQFFSVMMAKSGNRGWEVSQLMDQVTLEDIERYVAHCSKGLAEIAGERVQFIHETVRDFLLKDGGFQELWPQHQDFECFSHDMFKTICVECLEYHMQLERAAGRPCVVPSYQAFTDQRSLLKERSPFLEYAGTLAAFRHAERAAPVIPQTDFLTKYRMDFWLAVQELVGPRTCSFPEAGLSLLHLLICCSWPLLASTCIRAGIVPVNTRAGALQRSPLHIAIAGGHVAVASQLLDDGANINIEDANGLTPLEAEVAGSDWSSTVPFLLANGATVVPDVVASVKRKLFTPSAMENGQEDLFLLLLSGRASSRPISLVLGQHLHEAVRTGDANMIELLLRKGASVETLTSDGDTVLHTAIRTWAFEPSREFIFLLDLGADVTTKTAHGDNVLHIAIKDAISSPHELVSPLLKRGVGVEDKDSNGYTALQLAVKASRYNPRPLIETLVEHKANIEASDDKGWTPLMAACREMEPATVSLLLHLGASASAVDPHGNTLLMHAFQSSHSRSVVSILLETPVNLGATNSTGQDAFAVLEQSSLAMDDKEHIMTLLSQATEKQDQRTPQISMSSAIPAGATQMVHSSVVAVPDTDKRPRISMRRLVRRLPRPGKEK